MSRHTARASTDPTRTSPKVTWGTIVAGVLTIVAGVLTILASAVAAIPQEIPLGVVTGIIGAPVFLILMGRSHYRFGGQE